MKHIQNSYVTGYVTIVVTGNNPELFFQACVDKGIVVWDVKKVADSKCEGSIRLSDLKIMKKIRKQTGYKINFINRKGYPFLLNRFLKRKEIITSISLSLILIVFLSNILWKVTITGVSKELEEKINTQLIAYGIHPGSWIFSLGSPNTIQQNLASDLPELLWVGVQKKGTTFYLEGVEKTIVKKEEIIGPQNLVATKKGIIKSIFVSKGLPLVHVNDYVEPGDVLVSGILNQEEEESENEDETKKQKGAIAAQADITAQTWYEVSVTVPLIVKQEVLTGNQKSKYVLQFGSFQLPIWGFGKSKYESAHHERVVNPLSFLKWELPIDIVESIISEKMYTSSERTREKAIEMGILQAKQDLELRIGPEAKIISEIILHESIENGKVNLNLYITVEENIARAEPIVQGD